MQKYLIKNISVVNEGNISAADVLLAGGRIEKIAGSIGQAAGAVEINGEGLHLLPGAIDDQVHFREPGLTHKAEIATESRAAVAGGVTSFMEMPNTVPPVFTQELLEQKYERAAAVSAANYSFYMGTSNDNADEVLRTNEKKDRVCGVKVFMGSSTGGLLVDNYLTLNRLFENCEVLIATHCEDEKVVAANMERLRGSSLGPASHPQIRDEEACFQSSFTAVQLAKKHNTRLHILHITTERELQLFTNMMPLAEKRITAEVCVHHLHFTAEDYQQLGYLIKCNPAIKAPGNKYALWKALLDGRLDVIATDHAPHTLAEKGWRRNSTGMLEPVPAGTEGYAEYTQAHAGLPLVQHGLLLMLHYYKLGMISLEQIAEKMSHNLAVCYGIRERGFLREGYYADAVIVDLNGKTAVTPESLYYKCGWSPLEGMTLPAVITHTFVNGRLVYGNGRVDKAVKGERLLFNR
jgi:dihydroorotase